MNYFPILDTTRSNSLDCRYFGLAFLYDKNGKIKGKNSNSKFYLRSMMKPIQASVLSDEIVDYYNFKDEELALMQASHAGEEIHINFVKLILDKIGLTEENLLCPLIPPLNTKNVKTYSKIHNNCSGKHSMMLAYCVYNNLEIKNYTDFNHPVQLKIKEKLLDYAKTNDYITTKDGCTVPVFGLKIDDIAKLFLNYYKDKKNKRLINAYKNNPYLIAGTDDFGLRTDTKIMKLNSNLISKVGAGGFIYIYNEEKEEILIIKMAQDNNKAREIAALEILYSLNWLEDRYYDKNVYLEDKTKIGEYILNPWE